MKKNLFTTALLALFLVVLFPFQEVNAGSGDVSIGIKGGLHMPMGDYKDAADNGFTLGAEISMPINDTVTGGLSLNYNKADVSYTEQFGYNGWQSEAFKVEGDITMIEILLCADYNVTPMFFLRGGFGLNIWDNDSEGSYENSSWNSWEEVGTEGNDGSDPMMALGGGVNFTEHLQALVLFNRIFGDDDDLDYLNITLGYKF